MIDKALRPETLAEQSNGEEQKGKPFHRFLVVAAVLVGFTVLTVFQLVRWQIVEHGSLVAMAQAQAESLKKKPAPIRGRIMDSSGHLLAIDVFEYSLWVTPREVSRKRIGEIAQQLGPILGLSSDEILEIIGSEGDYLLVKKHIPQQALKAIENLDLTGFYFEVSPKRVYPAGPFMAHVIGFVNASHAGFGGVEGYYDRQLVNESNPLAVQVEDNPILALYSPVEHKPGRELVLTIDRSIQYMVERELVAGLKTYKASSGTIIVMEPSTGKILAMASYPTYDPNHFASTPQERFANPAVSRQYEPGSVFKVLTIAAGIDSGVITPRTTYNDTGVIEVGGRPIYNWDRGSHGETDMTELLAKSLNVGAAHVSTLLGKERFYTYLRRFGFGRLTDVDLADEAAGTLKLPGHADWHESDLGTNSFGQGIAVTPLQMVRAVAAVANHGLLMRPYVVGQIIEDGKVTEVKPTVVRRAISATTAEQVATMMVEAVKQETPLAIVPGYTIAGKTGTAEIPTPGGYKTEETIASFIGFAPAYDPKFIVLVKIDRPKASPWGSKVAAPVFQRVAEQLFAYLEIPPDNVGLVSR